MIVDILIILWNASITIAVPNIHLALAIEVLVEHVHVVRLPPLTNLPVPGARQDIEQLLVLHANQREKVLVSQVALEMVLLSQAINCLWCDQAVVEC